jgi:hypothetical protein
MAAAAAAAREAADVAAAGSAAAAADAAAMEPAAPPNVVRFNLRYTAKATFDGRNPGRACQMSLATPSMYCSPRHPMHLIPRVLR